MHRTKRWFSVGEARRNQKTLERDRCLRDVAWRDWERDGEIEREYTRHRIKRKYVPRRWPVYILSNIIRPRFKPVNIENIEFHPNACPHSPNRLYHYTLSLYHSAGIYLYNRTCHLNNLTHIRCLGSLKLAAKEVGIRSGWMTLYVIIRAAVHRVVIVYAAETRTPPCTNTVRTVLYGHFIITTNRPLYIIIL